MTTTEMKLKHLTKHKARLTNKANTAFAVLKRELVDFIKSIEKEPDTLLKYLAMCTQTDSVISFMKMMDGAIEDAKKCKGDPDARKAVLVCSYIKLRYHMLSNFILPWTTVKVKCSKCRRIVETNFLYSDKICPYCGNIIL